MKKINTFLQKYHFVVLISILCFAFVTRMYRLHAPETYVFDEVYHAVTAHLIADNDPRAFEWWNPPPEPNTAVDWLHPPLAKYTQATMINLFGYSSFGWRLSSVLFGVATVGVVYLFARELFDREVGLLAAFLASLDGLLLTQSRIAMNDIHVTFFILLSFWLYVRFITIQKKHYLWLTGLALGAAISSKWSGVFAIGIIGLSELVVLLHKQIKKYNGLRFLQQSVLRIIILLLLPGLLYVASYGQMYLQGKNLQHLYKLHQQIWWYQTNLDATHDYQSRPWQWFLNVRPVWYHVEYIEEGVVSNIYAFGNPFVQLLGVATVAISVIWLANQVKTIIKKKKLNWSKEKIALSWLLLSYFLLWLPWQLSPRIMFYYHYTPAIPLLVTLIAYWLHKADRTISIGLVSLCVLAFIAWYPNWVGLGVNSTIRNNLYFAIESWK